MSTLPNSLFDHYRLLLVTPLTQLVLAEPSGSTYRLPRISILRSARVAEQVGRVIEQLWLFRATVIDFLESQAGRDTLVLAEIRSFGGACSTSSDQCWDDIADFNTAEYAIVSRLISVGSTDRGPFSRLGWMDDALDWVSAETGAKREELASQIRQLNASSRFALIRFGTSNGPAYWLKAVSEPNFHEFRITTMLADKFPQHLPRLLAARPDWNAWLMEELGRPLSEECSSASLEKATGCLAELQRDSIAHVDSLLSAGCFDQRMTRLRQAIPELIAFLEEAMEEQTTTKVPPLSADRLQELGCMLEDACDCAIVLQIPAALGHNDMNAGNILVDGTACVFVDWAEGYVGNPFLTFEQLRVLASAEKDSHTNGRLLTAIYVDCWRDSIGETRSNRACVLSPPLAIASHLYGRGTWLTSTARLTPYFQSYARSLARHMNRAAQASEFLEALRA
jgi:hypothetical protein